MVAGTLLHIDSEATKAVAPELSYEMSRAWPSAKTNVAPPVCPNPAALGNSVMLTARVVVVAPGAAPLTAQVTFKDGTTVPGTENVVGGIATLSVSSLAHGKHKVMAVYRHAQFGEHVICGVPMPGIERHRVRRGLVGVVLANTDEVVEMLQQASAPYVVVARRGGSDHRA
jgi:hypothetical protein